MAEAATGSTELPELCKTSTTLGGVDLCRSLGNVELSDAALSLRCASTGGPAGRGVQLGRTMLVRISPLLQSQAACCAVHTKTRPGTWSRCSSPRSSSTCATCAVCSRCEPGLRCGPPAGRGQGRIPNHHRHSPATTTSICTQPTRTFSDAAPGRAERRDAGGVAGEAGGRGAAPAGAGGRGQGGACLLKGSLQVHAGSARSTRNLSVLVLASATNHHISLDSICVSPPPNSSLNAAPGPPHGPHQGGRGPQRRRAGGRRAHPGAVARGPGRAARGRQAAHGGCRPRRAVLQQPLVSRGHMVIGS
jgi:hypothetical protein